MKTSREQLRKRAALCVAVLFLAPGLYVASYGPVHGLTWRLAVQYPESDLLGWILQFELFIYWPLNWIVHYGPIQLADLLVRYFNLFAGSPWK